MQPVQSPLVTDTVLTWSMNFCAGASPPEEPLDPRYFDNTAVAATTMPMLHPLFLASTREVIGAWAALYAAGAAKEEIVKHTFVHHTYDAIFYEDVFTGSQLKTAVTLAGVGRHHSGGTHFVTALETTRHAPSPCTTPSSADGGGRGGRGGGGGGGGAQVGSVAAKMTSATGVHNSTASAVVSAVVTGRSWWGGVLLGLAPEDGQEMYMQGDNVTAPPRPCLSLVAAGTHPGLEPQRVRTQQITVPAGQAHIFDGCIRDPRNVKARSADINTHTNIGYALKAGLPGRTLNGMCLLMFVLPAVMRAAAAATRGADFGARKGGRGSYMRLHRIGCTFSSPVILKYTAVPLVVHIVGVSANGSGEAGKAKEGEAANAITVHFEVYDLRAKRVLKDGFVVATVRSTVQSSKL